MFQRALMLALALCAAVSAARADEPAFELVRKIGDVEIRRYAPYLVAEMQQPGPLGRARDEAMSVLSDYAAGDNELRRKVVFMSPMIVSRVAGAKDYWGREARADGPAENRYTVQAVLGVGGDASGLPPPNDARLRLRAIPAATLAVIRFKGQASERDVEAQLTRLTAILSEAKAAWVGEPLLCTYDRPLTPGFMRRNELWLRVQSPRTP